MASRSSPRTGLRQRGWATRSWTLATGAADADSVPAGGLAGLLGATRARVIRAVAAGCTTTELARALGIAPATASEHATMLRKSGLISTQRHRNTALHTLTPLGIALIGANPADPPA